MNWTFTQIAPPTSQLSVENHVMAFTSQHSSAPVGDFAATRSVPPSSTQQMRKYCFHPLRRVEYTAEAPHL